MPILPKGNSKRSLGPNFTNASDKFELQTVGSLVDFRCPGCPETGATLPNFGQFTPVFGWEVEGACLSDVAPTSALPYLRKGGKEA